MTNKLRKIYIVGGQGSGKTTLANKLSKKLEITHFDLDIIRQPGDIHTVRTIVERNPYISEIAKQKEWVAEGIYVAWVKDILDESDQILFLDFSPFITIPRVLFRYIKRIINRKDKYGFVNEMSLVIDIINYHYPKAGHEDFVEDRYITRKKTLDILNQYKGKAVIFKDTKSVDKYLQDLSF